MRIRALPSSETALSNPPAKRFIRRGGWSLIPLGLISLALLGLSVAPATAAAPAVGEPAPDFEFHGVGADSEVSVRRSSDYVGESARKKGVVVAWFPKAFTPG